MVNQFFEFHKCLLVGRKYKGMNALIFVKASVQKQKYKTRMSRGKKKANR
jgi:hypothetical protein